MSRLRSLAKTALALLTTILNFFIILFIIALGIVFMLFGKRSGPDNFGEKD